jgi:uncharacterized protein YbjT (DUF2867 family)
MKQKTAIIIGATGLTGSFVLKQLLEDNRYDQIKVFGRNSCGINHPKLKEYLGDLFNLAEFESDFKADEVYVCIGTTKKKTPNQDDYRKIDFGIPVSVADLCEKNNISTLLVISSIGANAKSKIFYTQLKGEMEEAVLERKITNTYLFRPSFIGGNRTDKRAGEKLGIAIAKGTSFLMIGPLKQYKMITGENLAKALIRIANGAKKSGIISSIEIQSTLKQ